MSLELLGQEPLRDLIIEDEQGLHDVTEMLRHEGLVVNVCHDLLELVRDEINLRLIFGV